MNFDFSKQPNYSGMPAALQARATALFYKRRALGLNVQFRHEDGALDEWSFRDAERANGFADSLRRKGTDCVISY